jgi:outer membrane protein assembly factor BamB
LASGKLVWQTNILAENGSLNIPWAMAGSPLIVDDVVVVNPGAQSGSAASRAIVAFDAATGKPRWRGGIAQAGYASPVLANLAGARQIVDFDAAGLAGHDATDGRELWRFPWTSHQDINAAQPVVLGDDRILITSATGAALIQVAHADDAWQADEVWRNRKLKASYAAPIVYQGNVYGIDERILTCLELSTGKQLWKDRAGQLGHGQLLLAGDMLVALAESGELVLIEATPEAYRELGRIQAIEGKTWNNPTLIGRRILVRNHLEMAAYDLPEAD